MVGIVAALLAAAIAGHAALRSRLGVTLAARQVAMDLNLARIRAIARNRDQRLVFSPGASHYRAQERTPGGHADVGPAISLPAGVRIADCTAADDAIGFRARGGASTFGTVTLRSAAGDRRDVVVGITGRARIQ